jgi:luciferase family oxidoreductase group 1
LPGSLVRSSSNGDFFHLLGSTGCTSPWATRPTRSSFPSSTSPPSPKAATPSQSFRNSLDLAQHAERWGYQRFWLAEHHGMPGIASAATSVLIGHVAGGTKTIRVGAGGIMLPNHSPLVIAEQFGTLEALYPGRIDLGLGRAPGSDQTTARALRRTCRPTPTNSRATWWS